MPEWGGEREGSGGDMDLSLRIDPPSLPGRQSGNLGSDLSLGWLPLSPLAAHGTNASASAFGAWEVSDAPYSPSNSWSIPELGSLPAATDDDAPSLEQSPLLLSWDIGPALVLESTALDNVPQFVLDDEGFIVGSNGRADNSLPSAAHPLMIAGDAGRDYQHIYPTRARERDLQTGQPAEDYSLIHIGALTFRRNGGSSSGQELRDFPEFRMQRLIESSNRWRVPRSRSSLHGLPASGAAFLTNPERLRDNIVRSWRSLEDSRKNAAGAGGRRADGSDKDEDKSDDASNFECNICFDLAKGPVVTPCGHLFCWPCLYHWLQSPSSECPVCKGQVLEVNVTPIYGRGGTESNKCEDGESDIKIPPRPHAKRIESTRQQFQMPDSQILEGRLGFRTVILDEEVPNGVRTLPRRSSNPRRRSNVTQSSTGVRPRAHRTQRVVGSGSNSAAVGIPNENTPNHQLAQQNNNHTLPDSSMVASGVNHDAIPPRSFTGLFSDSLHYSRHRIESSLAADHSSDSSTMAVIHGDIVYYPERPSTLTDASTEPSRRSSSTSRRRGRNAISDSVHDDGGPRPSRNRRI